MKGLISVIIPVYNREKYIEECLNSLFSQSYENFVYFICFFPSTYFWIKK